MTSEQAALPVLDMRKAQDPTTRAQTARDMVAALRDVGFLYVDNALGLDFKVMEEMCRWFHALSDDHKMDVARFPWNPKSKQYFRGYFPVQPGEVSYKEGFEMVDDFDPKLESGSVADVHPFFLENTVWPERAQGVEKFKADMTHHFNTLFDLSSDVLRLLALGSGMDEHWFDSMFRPNSQTNMRLMHYPPRPEAPPPAAIESDGVAVCTADHSDSGFVTLLATFNFTGLQVLDKEGKWIDVPPRPNSLVMNIGDSLAFMTNGKLKATRHRVKETYIDRFSLPFFIEPRYDAIVSRILPPYRDESDQTEEAKDLQYGPWLLAKLCRRYPEYRDMVRLFEDRNTAKA